MSDHKSTRNSKKRKRSRIRSSNKLVKYLDENKKEFVAVGLFLLILIALIVAIVMEGRQSADVELAAILQGGRA